MKTVKASTGDLPGCALASLRREDKEWKLPMNAVNDLLLYCALASLRREDETMAVGVSIEGGSLPSALASLRREDENASNRVHAACRMVLSPH